MSSKKRERLFSWHKSRQSSEPYYRTGGLLSIDTSVGGSGTPTFLADEAKNTPSSGRRRPPNLNLTIPQDYNTLQNFPSPAPCLYPYNAALASSASNLLAVFNDMLRSPMLSTAACSRSAEVHNKPLPSRPRSVSLPSSPDLPAELPGSILLENQGFLSLPVAAPATHHNTMRSARSGNSLSLNATGRPSPSKVPLHKKSLSEASLQRRPKSRPNLITSPSSTDSKLTTCSVSTNGGHTSGGDSTQASVGRDKLLQPSPLIVEGKPWRKAGEEYSSRRDELGASSTPTPTSTRSRQIEELKATITAQDSTISTLQAQFGSLRKSHEAELASLKGAHSAEVSSIRNYARVLEEQQSQRTLHHASSNQFLLLLDTTDNPQSPTRDNSQHTAGSTSANSIRSFSSALEQQSRSPLSAARDTPEMENLKRKLSSARRPETGNRDMIRELNQYKQNNAALQKQIESLMAKLNQSKKNERTLTQTLEEVEKQCAEWQEKASKVDSLEKSTSALQNTIDHLEHRLEIANCEKLDAEEQLFNIHSQRSPFDMKPPKLQMPASTPSDRHNAHLSMSTVFSSGSPTSPDSQEPSTLAAFIAHIERLQDQVKQKDGRISEVEKEQKKLRKNYDQLAQEHQELTLQSDIQGKLITKNKQSDVHMDQLRTAIIERESVIAEKEKSLRVVERQLEHHKWLLHAEIRHHGTMSLFADTEEDPLPDFTTLASKEDIDRWVGRLQTRLKKNKMPVSGERSVETTIEDLRKEIDFYVREIIYFKLDIKGYKSDIKKLKSFAHKMGSRTSDIESPTPSNSRSGDTPIRSRFPFGAATFSVSNTPSPVLTGPNSVGRPATPPSTVAGVITPEPTPPDVTTPKRTRTMVPQTPPRKNGRNRANEADGFDPGISPRSVARLSPERRKPTPPSPDQERFGELSTNFPLSTPAAPKRHDTTRSNSDSIIQMYTSPRTPEWSHESTKTHSPGMDMGKADELVGSRQRSSTNPDASREISTPERPPRPRYGLYESPSGGGQGDDISTPPRMDVMAEAMRNSPDHSKPEMRPYFPRKLSDSSAADIRGLSNSQLSRPGTSGSMSAIPAPLRLRPRAGSDSSSTAALGGTSSPQRKLSNGSSGNIPFIIGMPSPHNPAMLSPITTVTPTNCSIMGKYTPPPTKLMSPTSRVGVGGTMASSNTGISTPLTSPVSPTDASKSFFGGGATTSKGSSSRAVRGGVSESASASASGAKSRGHSRNTSASSIRSAMQLPGVLHEKMKGKGKARKDSISAPRPLASPFDSEPSKDGIGEAL